MLMSGRLQSNFQLMRFSKSLDKLDSWVSINQPVSMSINSYVTQYNKRDILSTFEKIEIFALSNRRFNKLSNDTKLVKIKVILLKIQVLQGMNFLLFSLYFTHCFAHYLRINLADKISLLLYWVTYMDLGLVKTD